MEIEASRGDDKLSFLLHPLSAKFTAPWENRELKLCSEDWRLEIGEEGDTFFLRFVFVPFFANRNIRKTGERTICPLDGFAGIRGRFYSIIILSLRYKA